MPCLKELCANPFSVGRFSTFCKIIMTDSQSVQQQRQSIFGLKEIRESRGISFRQVVEATRVSPQMIQALEGCDFSKLPEPVYTKAFLRSYARALNIDSTTLIERYEDYCRGIQPPEKKYDHLKKRRHRRSALPRVALTVIVVAVVSLAAYYYCGSQSAWYPVKRAPMSETKELPTPADEVPNVNKERLADRPGDPSLPAETGTDEPPERLTQAEPMEDDRKEEVPSSLALPDAGKAAPDIPTAGVETISDELVLEIRATELTWLRIKKDNEPSEQLYLKAGSMITRRAESRFDIIVGNAGGAEIFFQGSSLGRLGRSGEVVSIKLPGDKPQPLKPD